MIRPLKLSCCRWSVVVCLAPDGITLPDTPEPQDTGVFTALEYSLPVFLASRGHQPIPAMTSQIAKIVQSGPQVYGILVDYLPSLKLLALSQLSFIATIPVPALEHELQGSEGCDLRVVTALTSWHSQVASTFIFLHPRCLL